VPRSEDVVSGELEPELRLSGIGERLKAALRPDCGVSDRLERSVIITGLGESVARRCLIFSTRPSSDALRERSASGKEKLRGLAAAKFGMSGDTGRILSSLGGLCIKGDGNKRQVKAKYDNQRRHYLQVTKTSGAHVLACSTATGMSTSV